MTNDWMVYLLLCNDGSFYCGATNNMEKRLKAHNGGSKGARYTRTRRPVTLVSASLRIPKWEALKLERRIKRLRKADKVKYLNNYTGESL